MGSALDLASIAFCANNFWSKISPNSIYCTKITDLILFSNNQNKKDLINIAGFLIAFKIFIRVPKILHQEAILQLIPLKLPE